MSGPVADPAVDQAQPHDEDAESQASSPLTMTQARRPLLLSVGALILVLLAGLGGFLVGRPSYPSATSPDAGFARDMPTHHAQAVDMSLVLLRKSPASDASTLAYDIATTQENQRGQMRGWLVTWGLSQASSEPPMIWMQRLGHEHSGAASGSMLMPDGRMPGMATVAQMQRLRTLKGTPAETLFLQLMIIHHRAGVEMAQACVESCHQGDVVRLATTMVTAQRSEITQMSAMLKQRGAAPLPTPTR